MTKIKEEWSPDSLEFIERILCVFFNAVPVAFPPGLYSSYLKFFKSIKDLFNDKEIKFYKKNIHALCNKTEDDLIFQFGNSGCLINKELARKILVLAELSNVEYKTN